MNNLIITGVAGFIGMHMSQKLLSQNYQIIGIDNLNTYYDIELKKDRLKKLKQYKNFNFILLDITNFKKLNACFNQYKIKNVIHFAAQAGVRYSFTHPQEYGKSNLVGFLNVLEACRENNVEHLIYASSSSVYGNNLKTPFSEDNCTDFPVSLYAATKKANEVMAHSYSHLYKLKTTGLRFFTVYGPWGRPDMSPLLFARAIFEKRPIKIYNYGQMKRDFTYIDDIIESISKLLEVSESEKDKKYDLIQNNGTPCQILNIGNNHPVQLMHYIETMEKIIGRKSQKNFLPMQDGDVLRTYANTERLNNLISFKPNTSLEIGLSKFINWVKDYYKY